MAVGNGCGMLFVCLCCVYICVMVVGNGCGTLFRYLYVYIVYMCAIIYRARERDREMYGSIE
jgi:hypothetical protein